MIKSLMQKIGYGDNTNIFCLVDRCQINPHKYKNEDLFYYDCLTTYSYFINRFHICTVIELHETYRTSNVFFINRYDSKKSKTVFLVKNLALSTFPDTFNKNLENLFSSSIATEFLFSKLKVNFLKLSTNSKVSTKRVLERAINKVNPEKGEDILFYTNKKNTLMYEKISLWCSMEDILAIVQDKGLYKLHED